MRFDHQSIENKWKRNWERDKIYKVKIDQSKPKYYVLDMFPYPSGSGLHVGHPLGYVASDIFSRYKRLQGYNVLHPMGFDSFGRPTENYAIENNIHPAVVTENNMATYKKQLSNLGFSFDWDRQVYTSDPSYYKWTQWIVVQLYNHYYDLKSNKSKAIKDLVAIFEKEGNVNVKAFTSQEESFDANAWASFNKKEKHDVLMNYRLVYKGLGYVNWCEDEGTVLSNDQVKDGRSLRTNAVVEQRPMVQWFLRITAYADRLLGDLETIDWSTALKTSQSNWIGRSEGASINFKIVGSEDHIEVFTTRPDTIYGATYMVLAPEHELVQKICADSHKEKVEEYVAYVKAKSELDRMAEKEVTGVPIGAFAINPFTEEQVPIWIGEYVLKDYGTGAIMAVPSDDERDFNFATKFDLPIVKVVDKSGHPGAGPHDKLGTLINSPLINGMEVKEAITFICKKVEEMKIGKAGVNYKLRDANFSRQRYWGEPFPIAFDSDGLSYTLNKEDLPLELPSTSDFIPSKDGRSPLSKIESWVNLPNGHKRETDTMPGVAGSSWYYLRYMDPWNNEAMASDEAKDYWQDVDLYVGGSEHAVAHLLYARFWHKFLFDIGQVPTNEPFKKLINQGMIQGGIEFIYLMKNLKDGHHHFLCAGLVAQMNDVEVTPIPIKIGFVKEYGAKNSFLNLEGIKSFIDWRPAYKDAIFECSKGIFHKNKFTPKSEENSDAKLVTHSEIGKMSKSKHNVINPDDVVEEHGADAFRMFEMFLGPIEQSKPWDINSIGGVSKFVRRYWALFYDQNEKYLVTEEDPNQEELKLLHSTLKKVKDDIERFSFNTCVSAFMEAVNGLKKMNCSKKAILQPLTIALAPFAPFITEELWEILGNNGSIHKSTFPTIDESILVENTIAYPISVNGKKRALLDFPVDASKEEMERQALDLEAIKKHIEGKEVKKIIIVPKRMINIVVAG